jgi:carbamoylphosphate synthase large subunit
MGDYRSTIADAQSSTIGLPLVVRTTYTTMPSGGVGKFENLKNSDHEK